MSSVGWKRIIQSTIATLLLLSATIVFLVLLNQQYALEHWLSLRYFVAWLHSALFFGASLSVGWRLLPLFFRGWIAGKERFVLASALGVLVFFAGVFVAGLLHLYGVAFFYLWPTILILASGPSASRNLLSAWLDFRRRGLSPCMPHTPPQLAAALLLLLGTGAVYLQVMTPLNLCADSYWYHVPIAENYAAAGGIHPFEEGWYLGAYPQLATILYTWAFQSPGDLFAHVLLCTHVEFVLFLVTLLGVSVLAGRLLGRGTLPWAAAALFLFPKIFVYDSNLNGGADHVLAFWAPALALSLIRLASGFQVREAIGLGLITAGAVLTKYQASLLLMPAGLFVAALVVRWRRIVPAIAWGLSTLAATTPHWLKNLIYYNDPFYPILNAYFPSKPFHRDAARVLEGVFWPQQFMLHGTFEQKLTDTLKVLATFSFVPNDWDFHGSWPVFGSLFTLLVPALLFLRAPLRVWLLTIGTHVGLVTWYCTVHEDRFLQAIVPWMAAVTAAGILLAWRSALMVRIAVALLVGLQVIWGADAYFIRTHAMIGDSPIRNLAEYLGSAQKQRYEDRYRFPASFERFGKRLPQGAKILVHQYNTRLGLGVEFATDSTGWQGAIEYLDLDSPSNAGALWRSIGVTHLMWQGRRGVHGWDELARETVFARTVDQFATALQPLDGWNIGTLGTEAKNRSLLGSPTRIGFLGCDRDPTTGIYTPRGLADGRASRRISDDVLTAESVLSELREANAVLIRPGCRSHDAIGGVLGGEFAMAIGAGDFNIWVRTRAP